ncbi:hypothetical protein PENSPDRAFT_371306 [Peniophora sp. CONT]|nr:hypothetical protein PENSPDRAFT_371306 [Peniophora sp. CONT]
MKSEIRSRANGPQRRCVNSVISTTMGCPEPGPNKDPRPRREQEQSVNWQLVVTIKLKPMHASWLSRCREEQEARRKKNKRSCCGSNKLQQQDGHGGSKRRDRLQL